MIPRIACEEIRIDTTIPAKTRFDAVPEEAILRSRNLLAAIRQEIPAEMRPLAEEVQRRTAGRFRDEILAVAARVGVDWRDVTLANVSYDLCFLKWGCSTIALATSEGPVVARNMDWWPTDLLAEASYLVRHLQVNGRDFVNAGWLGSAGAVTGQSSRGFAVVLNAVSSAEHVDPMNPEAYPMLLHLRRVLEDANSFDEALQMLSHQRLLASGLITLVGTANHQRVVLERTPTLCYARWAEGDRPLVATNDYRLAGQIRPESSNELYATTCRRFDTLYRMGCDIPPDRPVDDATLLGLLTDERIIQGITAQHVLLRPTSGTVKMFTPVLISEKSGGTERR